MNSRTLNTDLKKERGNLPLQIYYGGVRQVSDPFQVDAAAFVDAVLKGRGRRRSVRAWASRGRRQKGKREKGPQALFIEERVKRQARESRSLERQDKCTCRLDFRDNH